MFTSGKALGLIFLTESLMCSVIGVFAVLENKPVFLTGLIISLLCLLFGIITWKVFDPYYY